MDRQVGRMFTIDFKSVFRPQRGGRKQWTDDNRNERVQDEVFLVDAQGRGGS